MDNKLLDLFLASEELVFKEIEHITNKIKKSFKGFKLSKVGEPNKFKVFNIKELGDIMAIGIAKELESKELAYVMFSSPYFTRDKYSELLNKKEIELDDAIITLMEDLNNELN
jgi:hypothetical protein